MIDIAEHTLANGLKIVHNRHATSSMAVVNVLYKVGSKNENSSYTGLAHLCEHLMFGGTSEIPKFDSVLLDAGGENNAWTNADITNYYDIIPVANIETALWVESDRMRNILLSDKSVEVQRNVVQEEFKQRCLNTPYGDAWHLLRDMVYKEHPYRWPVIGKSLADIETVTRSVIRDFYNAHYVPNNAILSVVGNIDSDKLFSMVEKWFAHIDPIHCKKQELPTEPSQTAPRFREVEKDVPHNMLIKAYRMCGRKQVDYPACDLLSDILSTGRSSRMYRNIYAKGNLVATIDASITADVDPGIFVIKAQLLPGVSYESVENAINAEIEKIQNELVPIAELEKALNKFESNTLFSNIGNEERAANLAYCEMLGDVQLINYEVEQYRATTSNKIMDVARELFAESNCSTLYYRAK